MFKVNQYFEGKVTSMAFNNSEGTLTVGIMAPGDYEFGTSSVEYMTVVSGALTVLLSNTTEWKTYQAGETFIVRKNEKFKLKVAEETAYKCLYK